MAHFSALLTALLLVLAFVFYARLDIVLAVAMAALTLMMAWFIWVLPVGIGFFIALFVLPGLGNFMDTKSKVKSLLSSRTFNSFSLARYGAWMPI